jgi:RNase P subunit RPR2
MKLEVKKKIGLTEVTFHVETKTHMDFFKELRFLYDLPVSCGKCGNANLRVNYRTPLKNGKKCEYASVDCHKCQHTLRFGIHQNDERTMFSKGWEPMFNADGKFVDGDESDGTYEQAPPKQVARPIQAQTPQKQIGQRINAKPFQQQPTAQTPETQGQTKLAEQQAPQALTDLEKVSKIKDKYKLSSTK